MAWHVFLSLCLALQLPPCRRMHEDHTIVTEGTSSIRCHVDVESALLLLDRHFPIQVADILFGAYMK